MDPTLKDWIQAIALTVASAGGVVAAFKAVAEMRLNREQQERELLWKQALTWQELYSKMQGEAGPGAAMSMLEWYERDYTTESGRKVAIRFENVIEAFKDTAQIIDEREAFIRVSFEQFFEALALFERYLEIHLISVTDVARVMEYQIATLAQNKVLIQPFLQRYGFASAHRFLERFPIWQNPQPTR